VKKSNHRIFTKRKIIVIFLFAIFLPTLIVGFLSFGTFTQRREAVKKLLESNRWIAGETAVNALENGLLEYEKRTLKSEKFIPFIQPSRSDSTSTPFADKDSNRTFLLDSDFNIICPKTGNTSESLNQMEKEEPGIPCAKIFQRAESLEFSQKNYVKAAELYSECIPAATTQKQRASLLEKAGRCLFLARNMDGAVAVYKELGRNYGQLLNKAGHPYGLIAEFQLCEVAKNQKGEEQFLKIVFDLYKQIREGRWLVNNAVYDFYMAETETILNAQLKDGRFPELLKTYTEILNRKSPYRQKLAFSDFLQRIVIPGIKDKLVQYREADKAGRLLYHAGNDFILISYTMMSGLSSGQAYYGGFCWDSIFLKNQLIPKILEDISKESGLTIQIVDEKGANILAGQDEFSANGSLQMNFRQFPLPWKLVAGYSETKTLEGTSNRELIFFGVLLLFILGLMLLGVILIVRDINREAETTRQKTEFVHTISHELKTPLTLIRLYGETLQRKGNLSEEEKQDCYEIITKESERLTHLINNVLDFSRIEMGRKEFDFKVGDLAEMIDETLEAYRYHLEKKGFVIRKEIAHDLPELSFDAEAMASVLINLLSNCMKFSLLEKEVTVKLFAADGNAILQVADKGVGISDADISKIFRRFYQAENKLVSERRGSGLGLTLVKHITEAHHGSVKVDSEIGKGSTFSILLPLLDYEKL
jgi:signal transduction histidine kinase